MLTVTAAALQSIAVTPANPSIAKGQTEQFTATGTFSDNSTQDLTSQVTWASATTSVATITAGRAWPPPSARARRRSPPRSAAITRLDGAHGHRRGSGVDRRDAGQSQHRQGATEQFTATGTYSDNSTQNLTSQVTWASATTSVATITAAGPGHRRRRTGTSTISATLGGITGSTVLTVTAAVLQSIAVTPANPSVAKGLTEPFTATGTYSDNSTQDLTSSGDLGLGHDLGRHDQPPPGLATARGHGHLHDQRHARRRRRLDGAHGDRRGTRCRSP